MCVDSGIIVHTVEYATSTHPLLLLCIISLTVWCIMLCTVSDERKLYLLSHYDRRNIQNERYFRRTIDDLVTACDVDRAFSSCDEI